MRTRNRPFEYAVWISILLYLLILLSDSPTNHLITLPVRLVEQELGAFGACNGQTEFLLPEGRQRTWARYLPGVIQLLGSTIHVLVVDVNTHRRRKYRN